MATKKKQKEAPEVEEWGIEEWEKAYGVKCQEIETLRGYMKSALQHLTKAI